MDRGRPSLEAQLQEALALESKFQPHLELPLSAEEEISTGVRDGAAHVLRCLKVWYDLPSDVFFLAVNLMDRFLTRMKARPRHMSCISVASFLLAAKSIPGVTVPDPVDLIAISQCKCSLGDLERMQAIITDKLDAAPHITPITPLTLARLLHTLCDVPLSEQVMLQLEILACDANCVNFRPSEIALVSLQPSPDQLGELETLLKISSERTHLCVTAVRAVLARYNSHSQVPHRQRLVWRLSQRTMRLLRPTDRLVCRLPTIEEQGVAPLEGDVLWTANDKDELCLNAGSGWLDEAPPTTFHCDLD